VNILISSDYHAHGPGSHIQVLEAPLVRAEGVDSVIRSLANKPSDIEAIVDRQETIRRSHGSLFRLAVSLGSLSLISGSLVANSSRPEESPMVVARTHSQPIS
jgi:hypothetical protein